LAVTLWREKSSPFREAAGALNRTIIDSAANQSNGKGITMGDLNDGLTIKA
jgi:hypothetical protein